MLNPFNLSVKVKIPVFGLVYSGILQIKQRHSFDSFITDVPLLKYSKDTVLKSLFNHVLELLLFQDLSHLTEFFDISKCCCFCYFFRFISQATFINVGYHSCHNRSTGQSSLDNVIIGPAFYMSTHR